MTVRLNVRCCCQPQKILGTLEVGSFARFQSIRIPSSIGPIERIQVRVFFSNEDAKAEYAIYSDDHPVEYWRQFPTFIENMEGRS